MLNILEVSNLTKKFGGLVAVDSCSFAVAEKSIVGIMGPNGSGKTTMFNLISGFLKPDDGSILFKGKRIDNRKPFEIAERGIGRSFQLTRVFKGMTTLDNMLAASPRGLKLSQAVDKALELLELFGLFKLRNELGGRLSYGQQKLLEFARLLMLDFDFILLDEPVAGVHPLLATKILKHITDLRGQGKTFLIVEHSVRMICEVCDRIVVMEHGRIIADGTPSEIRCNEKVKKAYFLA